jgi:hypothetical protein
MGARSQYLLSYIKYVHAVSVVQVKVKRYSNPWTGPEGSRRLRLPDFKTIGT